MASARKHSKVPHWLEQMMQSRRFGWAVGLVVMGLSLIPKFTHILASDSTVYLFLAGRILDGERYYDDFFEFNSPLAIGTYIIPVGIGRLLGIAAPIAGKIFVTLLVLGCIGLVHCVIKRSREWSSTRNYNALIVTLFFVLNFRLGLYYNELTTKSILFLCFALPYLFSLQLTIEKRKLPHWLNAAVGTLLGLSACLKPHYLVFPVIVEMYVAIRMRSIAQAFRWSNLLALGIAIAYYAFILPVFFPGYFRQIPLIFDFYGPVQHSVLEGLLTYRLSNFLQSLLYLIPLGLWYGALRHYLNKLVTWTVFAAGLIASGLTLNAEALISFDQLSIYTFFVSLPFCYSLLVFLPYARVSHVGQREWLIGSLAVIIAYFSIFNLGRLERVFDTSPRTNEIVLARVMDYVHRYAPNNEPVYGFSEDLAQLPPVYMYSKKRPYPVLHTFQMMYRIQWLHNTYGKDLPEHTKKAEEYLIHSLMKFFNKTPPKMVFVSQYNFIFEAKFERGFHMCFPTMLQMLLNDYPVFRTMWEAHYQKVGTVLVGMKEAMEDDPNPQKATVKYEGKTYQLTLPPPAPIASWLDVYIRKD